MTKAFSYILLAPPVVAYLALFVASCITSPDDFAQVRIYNESAVDTLRVVAESTDRRVPPGDSLDIAYDIGGLHEIVLTTPHCTTKHYTDVAALSQREYIRYSTP